MTGLAIFRLRLHTRTWVLLVFLNSCYSITCAIALSSTQYSTRAGFRICCILVQHDRVGLLFPFIVILLFVVRFHETAKGKLASWFCQFLVAQLILLWNWAAANFIYIWITDAARVFVKIWDFIEVSHALLYFWCFLQIIKDAIGSDT